LLAFLSLRLCPSGQIAIQNTYNCLCHFEKLRDPSHNWAYPIVRLEAYFGDAKLQVEHREEFKKEIEFEPWADRMGASEETKTKLRKLLLDAPEGVKTFLTPRVQDDKMFFALHEAIIIGKKS
jgi:hypothetical protein